MKERNLALELVKFFAVITVANHWFGPLYGKWEAFATGGAIGDALFFFASGFTLFLGRFGRFDNWYKRRIRRIYPSIFAFAIILSYLGIKHLDMSQIIKGGGYWFVLCIMIYYVVLYFVHRFAEHKPFVPFLLSGAVILGWYLIEDSSSMFMFGMNYFKWGFYFLFMMMGAYLGNKTIELKSRPLIDLVMLILSVVVFYGIQFFAGRYVWVAHLQIVALIPLLAIVAYIYKLCSIDKVTDFMKTKFGLCLRFVSGLCLEIYICSDVVIKFMEGKMMNLFPLNLGGAFLLIVALAYVTRCLARVFSQIFEKDDMDWKAVFKLIP